MAGERGRKPWPELRILRGEPTAEELAALVVVLLAGPAATGSSPPSARSAWASPARAVRPPVYQTVDGWRRSGLPG